MRILTSSTVAVTVVLLCLASVPQRAFGQGVPDFIEVGKEYLFGMFGMDDPATAEVLEIGQGAWIKVKVAELDQPIWFNLDAVSVVIEMTEEMQATMASTRDRAYQAMMRSDLRNLVTAEEVYFVDHMTYASLTELEGIFTPSAGVTVVISDVSDGGWSATARHEESGMVCYIYIGSAAPPVEGMREGEPVCR